MTNGLQLLNRNPGIEKTHMEQYLQHFVHTPNLAMFSMFHSSEKCIDVSVPYMQFFLNTPGSGILRLFKQMMN